MADTSLTDSINALLTPLASVGVTAYAAQSKNQINADRAKAGKLPCTGQIGQPADCPAIFAPIVTTVTGGSNTNNGAAAPTAPSLSTGAIVAIVGSVVVVLILLLRPSGKRRSRKKSR